MYDIIIIGAGITGAFIAHNLSKYDLKVLVLEKNVEIADGVSKSNSAIIHSGYDPEPGTLKAKLNLRGNGLYSEITKQLNVDFKRIGSYTLAFDEEEAEKVRVLYDRGKENGVEVYLVNKKELLKREPNIREDVKIALYAPSTGILAPWDMIYALLENAVYNQVELHTFEPVLNIKKETDCFRVITGQTEYRTKYIINAAGLHTETITRLVTAYPGFKTIPTRGEYYVLDRGISHYINSVIYPAPSEKGKGVLIVPTIHGNFLLGPTSDAIDSKTDTAVTKTGLHYIREKIDLMVNNTPYKSIIRTFAGIRPKTDRHDFIIEELKDVPGFFQAAGIESPGLASAPAIAELLESLIVEKVHPALKSGYRVYAQRYKRLSEKTPEEINEAIKENPLYGKIVCRCEQVSEGEVIDAIHSPLGAATVDGVKRRVRPGAGRCQGGFCQPLILEILARELKKDKSEILLDNEGSNILVSQTKTGGEEIE